MLDEGYKTTTLYTDLANPTSNKIYQEIGYEQIAESVLIFLESRTKRRAILARLLLFINSNNLALREVFSF